MSNYPEVDDTVHTAFAAVRTIEASIAADDPDGRRRVSQLISDLVDRHGPDSGNMVALLLAEVAANGLRNYAEMLTVPVERCSQTTSSACAPTPTSCS